MTNQPQADWPAIKAAYEADDMTVDEIIAKFGVSRPTLYAHARRNDWHLRQPVRRVERGALIERMMNMVERQIRFMEMNLTGTEEKEVALLGNMARTLEKLTELDTREKANRATARRYSRDIEDIRRKLAARIDDLRKG